MSALAEQATDSEQESLKHSFLFTAFNGCKMPDLHQQALQPLPTPGVWLPVLWDGAWLRAEEDLTLQHSKAGTSTSSPVLLQRHHGDRDGGPLQHWNRWPWPQCLRPNWRPQRVKHGQRRPLPAQGWVEDPDEAYVTFPRCPMAFPATSELDPGRHPGLAAHFLGMSIGYWYNYILVYWSTSNNRYSYWRQWELDWAEERKELRCGQLIH